MELGKTCISFFLNHAEKNAMHNSAFFVFFGIKLQRQIPVLLLENRTQVSLTLPVGSFDILWQPFCLWGDSGLEHIKLFKSSRDKFLCPRLLWNRTSTFAHEHIFSSLKAICICVLQS